MRAALGASRGNATGARAARWQSFGFGTKQFEFECDKTEKSRGDDDDKEDRAYLARVVTVVAFTHDLIHCMGRAHRAETTVLSRWDNRKAICDVDGRAGPVVRENTVPCGDGEYNVTGILLPPTSSREIKGADFVFVQVSRRCDSHMIITR